MLEYFAAFETGTCRKKLEIPSLWLWRKNFACRGSGMLRDLWTKGHVEILKDPGAFNMQPALQPPSGRQQPGKSVRPSRLLSSAPTLTHKESIMEVCIFFLYAIILLPGIAANVHHVKSFLNHTAYLSCYFPNSQKSDLKNIIVFWQKHTGEVVHEVYLGQEIHDHLDPKYINRTKMDMDKWTLQLLNVGVVDEGQYKCIIMHVDKGPKKLIHESECLLHITANYSQPVIAQLHTGEPKPNENLNLSCSSSGGYPEPKQMIWLISSENVTDRLIQHMDVLQDAVTKLYNVTTKLNIPVPTNTLTNISCLLHLGGQEGSLVSVPLVIEIQAEEMELAKVNFFGPLIAVILLITLLLGFLILKNRNISSTSHSSSVITEVKDPRHCSTTGCPTLDWKNHPYTRSRK